MATDLTTGAIAGREHFIVRNSATHASPTWVQMNQARNLVFNKKRDSSTVELHGDNDNDHVVGNKTKDGSFEYVKKRGTDADYTAINTSFESGTILEIGILDGPANLNASVGFAYPIKITDMSKTANGNSETTYSVSFVKILAYDSGDALVSEFSITGTTPG